MDTGWIRTVSSYRTNRLLNRSFVRSQLLSVPLYPGQSKHLNDIKFKLKGNKVLFNVKLLFYHFRMKVQLAALAGFQSQFNIHPINNLDL